MTDLDSQHRDESLFRLYYIVLDLDQCELASLWGCSETTLRKWKHKHDLETEKYPYKDKEKLEDAIYEGLTYEEIADRFDTTSTTICHKVDEFDIELPDLSVDKMAEMYQNGDSLKEIGEELGCSRKTVSRRLRSDGYEIRDRAEWNRHTSPYIKSKPDYEVIRHTVDGTQHEVQLHRLVAVAEYGFDEVAGKDIHHKNHIPWDNRPSNLVPMNETEHGEIHGLRNAAKAKGDPNWHKVTP